jgi:hypothetical protein
VIVTSEGRPWDGREVPSSVHVGFNLFSGRIRRPSPLSVPIRDQRSREQKLAVLAQEGATLGERKAARAALQRLRDRETPS